MCMIKYWRSAYYFRLLKCILKKKNIFAGANKKYDRMSTR